MSEKEAVAVNIDPAATSGPGKALWAERTGTRQFLGRSSTGAEVRIGTGEGEFSPGDLLKLALATCNAMSADASIAHTLGDDFIETVGVSGEYNEEENRYESFQVEMVISEANISEEKQATIARFADKAIDKHCTVGNTLEAGADYAPAMTFEDSVDDDAETA